MDFIGLSALFCAASLAALPAGADPRASRIALTAAVRAGEPFALSKATLQTYRDAVEQVFLPPKGEPDLIIEVSIAPADVTTVLLNVPQASVTANVTVRSSTETLEHLRLRGTASILARDPESVSRALDRAALDSAGQLAKELPDSEPLVRWMLARHVQPVGSTILGPARGALVAFIEVGGGLVNRSDGLGPLLAGRLGLSGRWFLVRALADRWTSPWGASSNIEAQGLGLEVGPVVRLTRNWELQAGAGLHFVNGTLHLNEAYAQPADFSRKLPSLFLTVQYARWPNWKSPSRLRLGLEVRRYFDQDMAVDQYRRVVSIADTVAALTAGIEFGLISSGTPDLL